jgi:hypothetical protein
VGPSGSAPGPQVLRHGLMGGRHLSHPASGDPSDQHCCPGSAQFTCLLRGSSGQGQHRGIGTGMAVTRASPGPLPHSPVEEEVAQPQPEHLGGVHHAEEGDQASSPSVPTAHLDDEACGRALPDPQAEFPLFPLS